MRPEENYQRLFHQSHGKQTDFTELSVLMAILFKRNSCHRSRNGVPPRIVQFGE
jgi:hypothetical protein